MPIEREGVTPTGIVAVPAEDRRENEIEVEVLDPVTKERLRIDKIKSSMINLLDRGIVNERLNVKDLIPSHLYAEWIPNYPEKIQEAIALGFEDGSEYAAKRSLHHDGTKTAIADVVLMVQPMELHEHALMLRSNRFNEMNNPVSSEGGKRQLEEKNYVGSVNREDPSKRYVRSVDNSNVTVTREELDTSTLNPKKGYK